MDKQHEESNLDSRGAQNEFVPPRHWIGPEELDPGYWADPQVKEKRGQEFYEKPVEWLDRIDQSAQGGASRRDFLTVMGASMAMASFACARRPVHKIIPYVVKPEEITPGVPNWYASTCMECSSHCGILVKDREGRPIKLEGNPDHPVNQGKLCSQGQASLLNLYDPDRLKSPVVRSRGDGSRREADWKQVDSEIQAKLKAIASQNGRVKILSPEISGDSTRRLVKEFLSAFAQGEWVEFDPLSLEEIASAQADSYGTAVIPSYEFDRADVIVSLGADFLGTWLSPVEHAKAWSKNRKLSGAQAKDAKLSKLICFESMMSLTGSNADERYPVRPGDELKVALSLAHELVVRQKLSKLAQSPEVVAALKSYEPEKVGAEIGIEGYAGKIKS
ncbi:MAG: TAT-variant-translocated molybdopterin oxidoreductase [Bdellovibrionia bacterium]